MDEQERVRKILEKQDAFEKLVSQLQQQFYEDLLANYVLFVETTSYLDAVFIQFQQLYHLQVIEVLAEDILSILTSNEQYFTGIAGSEARKMADSVTKSITSAFGINDDGTIRQQGFMNDILQDRSILKDTRTFVNKQLLAGQDRPDAAFKEYILGTEKRKGLIESYYDRPDKNGSSLFDTYQKADRIIQNEYAEGLNLQAALYIGGLIATSRPFCIGKDGKVFLRDEIAAWKDLSFSGKPSVGYDPFQDCGGINCRHHLGWLSNRVAMRRDPTLVLDQNGNLKRI